MKPVLVLAALAVVQTVLLLVTGSGGPEASAGPAVTAPRKPFAAVQASGVGSLAITDEEGKRIELRREEKDGGESTWVLASSGNYPARAESVDNVMKALARLSLGRVITRRVAAFTELEVAESRFARHVVAKDPAGSVLVDLYVGNGKQPNTIVARLQGEDAAYQATGADTFEFSTNASSWVASLVFEAPFEEVVQASIRNEHGEFTVAKVERPKAAPPEGAKPPAEGEKPPAEGERPPAEGEKPPAEGETDPTAGGAAPEKPATETLWVLRTAEGEKDAEASRVETWLRGATRIYIADPVGTEARPDHGFDPPVATLTLTLKDGAVRTLELGSAKDKDGNQHLRTSKGPGIATIRSYTVNEVFLKRAADLVPAASGTKPHEHDHEPEEEPAPPPEEGGQERG
jgi:hypothetical protein